MREAGLRSDVLPVSSCAGDGCLSVCLSSPNPHTELSSPKARLALDMGMFSLSMGVAEPIGSILVPRREAKGFTHQPGAGAGTCVSILEEEGTGDPMSALLAKGGGSHLCPGGLEPLYGVLSPVRRGGQAQSCTPF